MRLWMIVQAFAHGAEFLWSQGLVWDTRLLNWLWPVKLCLGGVIQFHHSAGRNFCFCAGLYGLINVCVCVCWQTGVLLRMWFTLWLHLWILACVCEQSVFVCMAWCVCVSVSVSRGLWSRSNLVARRCRIWYFLRQWPNITRSLIQHSSLIPSIPEYSLSAIPPPSPPRRHPYPSPCTGHFIATPPSSLLHVSPPQQQLGSTCSWWELLPGRGWML